MGTEASSKGHPEAPSSTVLLWFGLVMINANAREAAERQVVCWSAM